MFVLNRLGWMNPAADNAMLEADGRRALARDVGVAESVFAIMTASRSTTVELSGLMEALSIDDERVHREHRSDLREMQIACSTCNVKRRCRRNLRNGKAASTFRQYCPNAEAMEQLSRPV